MHFNKIERVEYENNILFEVIFQARFPEIMKISNEEPSVFQDMIRKEGFPESPNQVSNVPVNLTEEIKRLITKEKEFEFLSENKDWKVSLSSKFIAVSCMGTYLNFIDFKEKIAKVLKIFCEVYSPSYFTRVGVRYQNIANSTLFSTTTNVREFIPVYVAPELKESIASDIKSFEKSMLLEDNNIKANVRHSLTQATGKLHNKQFNDEDSYIIDIDCYTDEKVRGEADVIKLCEDFKAIEWNIFQWSITNKLREQMEPKARG
jgi:uncharacterized protein (TIGR04255 family)